jgi:hypothetical protein
MTGSLASNMYGVGRATNDADFVLITTEFDFTKFRAALGSALQIDPQMSFETVTGTSRYIIKKVKGRPFKIELFFLSDDAHDLERFKRRKSGNLLGESVWVATPEDVIITKLRWSRSKDLEDARYVIAVQQNHIDWEYVRRWCNVHGTLELLESVKASIPDI